MKVIALRSSGTTLDEVRAHRDGASTDLILQRESLLEGHVLRRAVYVDHKSVGHDECLQVAWVSAHARVIGRSLQELLRIRSRSETSKERVLRDRPDHGKSVKYFATS